MCGIAGWMGNLGHEPPIKEVMESLRHRGPDSHGSKSWPNAGLIHTRLSILDLSEAGRQPVSNEDGTIWIAFNGEIYNHKTLRKKLAERGHILRGHSDCAVIPHLYEEHGVDFVDKLRGMFVIAVYDVTKRTMTLVRDRCGIKPLYYAPLEKGLVFASELNAIRKFRGVDTRPDMQAIHDFLGLLWVPGPATFFSGIKALQPGQRLRVSCEDGRIHRDIARYHCWSIQPDRSLTLSSAVERAEELIMNAVRSQLESDVPLGALLSGGIDSSLVSLAAQASLPRRLQTFNVRFPGEEFDETREAVAVAARIGSEHHTLRMDASEGRWDHVVALLEHAGQPFADTSFFAVNSVSHLMRQRVKVALSGDGGDEGFGGYGHHWKIGAISRLQTLPRPIWSAACRILSALQRFGSRLDRLDGLARRYAGAGDVEVVERLISFTSSEERRSMWRAGGVQPLHRLFVPQWHHHLPRKATRIERLSALLREIDFRLILPNDYLFKVDMASMRESLEVRVPMLDEDLVGFALRVPHKLSVKGRTCKIILRELAKRHLPVEIARKPKRGFAIPFDVWVDSSFVDRLRSTVLSPSSRLPEILDPSAYRHFVESFCSRQVPRGLSRKGLFLRVVMLLSLHQALGKAF